MTTDTTTTYDLAVARRIHNARHAKALRLANVAIDHMAQVGASVEDLEQLGPQGWDMIARLAQVRRPSAETIAVAIGLVRRFSA